MLVRPSYVLGGRAMVIAYEEDTVRQYMREAVTFSQSRPVLIDRFLEDATEVDVDALCDGEEVLIAGIMEHIEEAGVHSGDSSCVLPPFSLKPAEIETIKTYTRKLALGAERDRPDERAVRDQGRHGVRAGSESARIANCAVRQQGDGRAAAEDRGRFDAREEAGGFRELIGETADGVLIAPKFFVKSPVFPFNKFPGVDPVLGPEMRSTGEVMGVGENFGEAFAKAQLSAGTPLAEEGHGVHQRQRPSQAGRGRDGEAICASSGLSWLRLAVRRLRFKRAAVASARRSSR